MNKFVFPLLLSLFFIACQNTPKSASENMPAAPAAPAAPTPAAPEEIQKASGGLTSGIQKMEDLRKQVDALPTSVRKAKVAEIDAIYSTLEGMIEKQTGMLNEIKAADVAASDPKASSQEVSTTTVLTPTQLQDYNESVARYAKEAEAIQAELAKMSNLGKKN